MEKKWMKKLISLALCLVMVVGYFPGPAQAAVGDPGDITTVADPATLTAPEVVYGDNTKHAGKITVGKSVSNTPSITVDGKTVAMDDADNFLVTLSQTSQVMGMTSESKVPVDVVFVLDTSGSMDGGRADAMVDAANMAIATLMTANEYNRISVVAFSSAATSSDGTYARPAAHVLTPLAHYTGEAATNHLRWTNSRSSGFRDDSSSSYSYIIGRGTNAGKRQGYNGGTNIQAGIALGGKQLLNAAGTTVTMSDGQVITRIPFMVVLSDGAPTFAGEHTDWYDPTFSSSYGENGNGSSSYAGNGFLPALTAAYYKGKITEKYYGNAHSESNRCYVYTMGVDLQDKDLAEMTMNPRQYFARGSQNSYYSTFNTYWNSFNAATPRNYTINCRSDYTITADSIRATRSYVNMYGGLRYNDDYFSTSNVNELGDIFEDLVRSINEKALSVPTKVVGLPEFSGYVTFMDPIGEYMEVKDIKGIIADGNFYQGTTFANNFANGGDAAFEKALVDIITNRMNVSGGVTVATNAEAFIREARAQYVPGKDKNSIVWWGHSFNQDGEEDLGMQLLGVAKDDTISYITDPNTVIPENANMVCRSYFYYGTAGGTAANPNHQYLYCVVRVQRSLVAPYKETVVVSIPAPLLSVETVMIHEHQDDSYTAEVTPDTPVRLVYEVGLRSDINAYNVESILSSSAAGQNYMAEAGNVNGDVYNFYTNDWDRNTNSVTGDSYLGAMTKVTFDAAADNPFYAYQEDTLICNADGTAYTGSSAPTGTYYVYTEYYDWAGVSVNSDGEYPVQAKRQQWPIQLGADAASVLKQEGGKWYVKKGTYTASTLIVTGDARIKSENLTGTSNVAAHPRQTVDYSNSHYTTYLGNNGRLALTAKDAKTVGINVGTENQILDADGKAITVGDVLTYTITAVNTEGVVADITITDAVPAGTEFVDAANGGVHNNGTVTWNFEDVAVDGEVTATFRVKVTEKAMHLNGTSVNNQAQVIVGNHPAVTTNTTSNPPEGKKVTHVDSTPVEGSVQVGDRLLYTVDYHNDTDETITNLVIRDQVPAGTSLVVANKDGVYDSTTNTITWTFTDVKPGETVSVSFHVTVTAEAVTDNTITNTASIQIGNNDPEFTNETKVTRGAGELKLYKEVVREGALVEGNTQREFTLNLKESTGTLNGTFGDVTFTNGAAVVKIKHGQTVSIPGLSAGAQITVTEETAPGYTPEVNPGTVTVTKDTSVTVNVTNNYSVSSIPVRLSGSKIMTVSGNAYFPSTNFSFEAVQTDDQWQALANGQVLTGIAQVPAMSDGTSGNIAIEFAKLQVSAPGTYYFLIREIDTGIVGVTYDDAVYKIKLQVVDDGNGTLTAQTEVVDANAVIFENSYKPLTTDWTPTGTKTLTGRTLKEGEFGFAIQEKQSDGSWKDVGGGVAAANGAINFNTFIYDSVAIHEYRIVEIANHLSGVTYDDSVYEAKVVVSNNDGRLQTQVTLTKDGQQVNSIAFTNRYTPDTAPVQLMARKVLVNNSGNGKSLEEGQFDFGVYKADANGNFNVLVNAGDNLADGTVVFARMDYTLEHMEGANTKTFTYQIRELLPVDALNPFMDYDATVYVVKVTQTYDPATGKFAAPVVKYYEADGVTEVTEAVFTNTLWPDHILVPLAGTKITTKDDSLTIPEDATFSFVVKDAQGNLVTTGVAPANGAIDFTKISMDQAGEYTYYIEESVLNATNGITYSTEKYAVTITISKTGAQLKHESTTYARFNGTEYESITGTPTFTNVYAASGSITLYATKNLVGRPLRAGEFEYALKCVSHNGETHEHEQIVYGVTAANGQITFGSQYYTQPGVYIYEMYEIVPANPLPSVSYDTSKYTATVTVTEGEAGVLNTSVVYSKDGQEISADQVVFTNVYVPKATDLVVQANKQLTGRDVREGEFSFVVTTAAGEVVASGTNAAIGDNGLAPVSVKLHFPDNTKPGTYHYIFKEVNTGTTGITYDAAEYPFTVTIADVNGQLNASYIWDSGAETVTVVNSYVPKETSFTPEAYKLLNGRDMAAGEFTFSVYQRLNGISGDSIKSTGTVTAGQDGQAAKVTFSSIGFTNTGKYIYIIVEDQGNKPGVTYTDKELYLVVQVTDEEGKLVAKGTYMDAEGNEITDLTAVPFTNTYTVTNTTAELMVSKVLMGRNQTAGEFTFYVYDKKADGFAAEPKVIGTNAADGKVIFPSISYGQEEMDGVAVGGKRDFIYKIVEVPGTHGGVTYSNAVIYAKITVKHEEGRNVVESIKYYSDADLTTEVDTATFTNFYTAESTSAVITATKSLEGKRWNGEKFNFTLTGEGFASQTKANDDSGKVTFDAVSFTKAGTYTFTVAEEAASAGSLFTHDSAKYTVTVQVKDDGQGKLYVESVAYAKDGAAADQIHFVNSYEHTSLQVPLDLTLKKQVNAPDGTVSEQYVLEEGAFTFQMVDINGNVVATGTNDAKGNISLVNKDGENAFTFLHAGEYHYWVEEVKGQLPGMVYDGSRWQVTVLVKYDDLAGELVIADLDADGKGDVAITKDGAAAELITFVNVYQPTPVTLRVSANKILHGGALRPNEFTFHLVEVPKPSFRRSAPVTNLIQSEATNDAEGNVTFELTFVEPGEHWYKMHEHLGSDAAITYDDTEYLVYVKVGDANKDGNLEAGAAIYDTEGNLLETVTFENTYTAEPAKAEIRAFKTLEGRTLTAGEFAFELQKQDTEGNWVTVTTAVNDADGNVVLEETFDEVGTYEYRMVETKGTNTQVGYDDAVYNVTVTVYDDRSGQLKATVAYEGITDGSAPLFQNTWTPAPVPVVIKGTKVLEGRDMEEGEFHFQIHDSHGTLVANGKNDAEGNILFGTISFPVEGTYVLTVSEVEGELDYVTYDTNTFTVTVEVSNNNGVLSAEVTYPEVAVEFVNTYKEPPTVTPDTGDNAPIMIMVVIMVISAAAVVILLLQLRKKRS